MTKIQLLKELIRKMIVSEMSTTAGVAGFQTPYAFRKTKNKKKIKLFEDIINKAAFDIKFSDQATELMDFIKSNEKYEDDLLEIQQLFDKMKTDNTFSKEEGFSVYKEFIERASRDFIKQTGQDVSPEEYFLRKDILDVIYYHLSKVETPMSGGKNDNIDVPPEGAAPEAGAEAPPEEAPTEEPPKPEEIAEDSELKKMIKELYEEIKMDERK